MTLPDNIDGDLMILFGVVILFGRYALIFLDRQVNKFLKTSETDHGQFITHAGCKLHRNNCQSNKASEDRMWRKEFSVLKLVTYRIGRKLDVGDDVLEKLIADTSTEGD